MSVWQGMALGVEGLVGEGALLGILVVLALPLVVAGLWITTP